MQLGSVLGDHHSLVQDLLLHTIQPWNPIIWNSNLVHQLYDPPTARQIHSIPIGFAHKDDALLWTGDSSGSYTAKAGFAIYQYNGSAGSNPF